MIRSNSQDALVSIIGPGFFQPITDLISQLFKRPVPQSNEVQAHPVDNAYSVSICILTVTCLESFLARAKYIRKCPETKVLQFFLKCFPNYSEKEKFTELFVLRDSLVHNHLWEIGFSWNKEDGSLIFDKASKDETSGDAKYQKAVDLDLRKTKVLSLNVVPIKVDRNDVKAVLKEVWKVLMFLENEDRSLCYVSHLNVMHAGEIKRFGDLIHGLNHTPLSHHGGEGQG